MNFLALRASVVNLSERQNQQRRHGGHGEERAYGDYRSISTTQLRR